MRSVQTVDRDPPTDHCRFLIARDALQLFLSENVNEFLFKEAYRNFGIPKYNITSTTIQTKKMLVLRRTSTLID
jgi:hypothetical protein